VAEPNRDTLLRSIEDFEATFAELQSNNVALATVLRNRQLGAEPYERERSRLHHAMAFCLYSVHGARIEFLRRTGQSIRDRIFAK
jgi:hypothetical protein